MLRNVALSGPHQAVTLDLCAESAGAAMACSYSSSAEFEAAIVAARRAEGVYGPRRHRQTLITATAVVAALSLIVYFLI
jgi:hypothetical protein